MFWAQNLLHNSFLFEDRLYLACVFCLVEIFITRNADVLLPKASCTEIRSNLIPTGDILVYIMHKHLENKNLFSWNV